MINLKQPINNVDSARGTLTATALEQTVLQAVFSPASGSMYGGWIDGTAMQAGDTVVLRQYARVEDGGDWVLTYTADTYTGVQTVVFAIPETYTRYGVRITLQQTVGVGRQFPWEFFYTRGAAV